MSKESALKAELPAWTLDPEEWFALADIIFEMYKEVTDK